ncbi:2Fe-2S iron-sulfur cluster-binding protein [Oricola sp.]|uniref:2Fe-2S iron-sulfur cluster-binding protein n=1 Tax=Oricola sp. TaxID=1979950 RepID=UPI0025F309C6|nr:2Fe-2S iron-sulfur cluster-binding protein [Oricola sp.]MCI5076195.1 2Fe-2S iron-sulfur cluster-binding protein [Oricola sp.]
MTSHRLTSGGRIDRTKTVRFTFDGVRYSGFAGDTLASALLANGIRLLGRSFKYHRPRGLLAAGYEEPNALVTVIEQGVREPNIRATELEVFDGLVAQSQNRFPSLGHDLMAVNGLAGKTFSAGFYYKTFMGPAIGPLKGTRFWRFCEHFIRRAAGLGSAGTVPDPARYERMNAFCDVLVVGSGPSGLEAARKAVAEGKSVILCETEAALGGTANWSGPDAASFAETLISGLRDNQDVRLLNRTTVWGRYDGNTFAALERIADHKAKPATGEARHRHWVIRAGHVVLATGALERAMVFPGNDRPGVMLASAALRFARSYGVLIGRRIVVFANNDSAYETAAILHRLGAEIPAIIDPRPVVGDWAQSLADEAGAKTLPAHAIVGSGGDPELDSVLMQPFNLETGKLSGPKRGFACDTLLVSGGWSPVLHLASQAGTKPVWSDKLQAFLPPEGDDHWHAVGSCAGEGIEPPAPVFEIKAKGDKAFVDFQHDVTADDVRLAHREGFQSVEHLKRYTTLGMATDQGKTANVPGMAIMADALGKPIPDVGTTRFRPPFTGASLGALAAERFADLRPERLTPMHHWHEEHGAGMMSAGLWMRPESYNQPGETVEDAYLREARIVRRGVGIVDVSTLGKIDIKGPDAAEFLNRVYTNNFAKLAVGKARYGLMLREDGFAFDDGTTWRLANSHYLMTTTTANAGPVMQHLEYFLDCIWPDLSVNLTSVTDQWAGAAVAGPKSREVLAACVTGTAVDNEVLPLMGIVHGKINGIPVMICRLSFSGERAYEIYCGAHHGQAVWNALIEAGQPHGIQPYGLEALGALRIEKGHVTGAEIDGRTTAHDLHLDWMLSKKTPFIGSVMLTREGLTDPDRWSLVGVISSSGEKLRGGSHIVEGTKDAPGRSLGHITATCLSPLYGKHIGLALVENGNTRIGTRAFATDPVRSETHVPVEFVSHHFYDPKGVKMNG